MIRFHEKRKEGRERRRGCTRGDKTRQEEEEATGRETEEEAGSGWEANERKARHEKGRKERNELRQ